MRVRRYLIILAVAAAAMPALLTTGAVSAAADRPGPGTRETIATTAPNPAADSALRALPRTSRVRVSVFIGRDRPGLAAAATAVADPSSPRYEHYLSPAQVQAGFGATAAQQGAVSDWLARSGLTVTHRDGFVISAAGTVAQAEAAVHAALELSRPRGGAAQVVPTAAMSVPAQIAGTVSTINVAPATVPMTQHEPMRPVTARSKVTEKCSHYYGQKKASRLPGAYGKTLTWAPCGYLPNQIRHAYGVLRSGLTGAGVSVAILSEDDDPTVLSDANRWARSRDIPPFKPGQFSVNIARHVFGGVGDAEDAMDTETVHGMAPAARVTYVAGNGRITGGRLLDALDTVVTHRLADAVTSSWFVGFMPVRQSTITAWEGVLQRAAVEGITVNFASGDEGDALPLQYPGSDPWLTGVGGTSLAIGAGGHYLWETGWETDEARLADHGTQWHPSPPGPFREGTTGGISKVFAEPYYQQGVVTGNVRHGVAMRAVPDVSALGDWNLGYQIGLTIQERHKRLRYVNQVNGGTSLSSPLFTGLEADLIQGRHHISLGFANPALYDYAFTRTFHQITSHPQGQGVTEAVVFGPAYRVRPTLSTMGQCASTRSLTCGPGYSTVTGIGSPGPAFFSSFGSRPR